MANALKAVSKTDDSLIVENYIVLFGGRDLEGHITNNVNPDGSRGEFFAKSVALDSPYTDVGVLYVDWEHGYYEADGEAGKDDVLGWVDWKSAKADDTGVLVRRILNRRNAYVRMIEPLIEAGLVGTSSEAITRQVQKKATGEIVRWPLRRDTLTVAPFEPRMLDTNVLQTVKALADEWPALKAALFPDDEVIAIGETKSVDDIEQPDDVTGQMGMPEADTPEAGSAPAAAAVEPDATHAKRLALEIELLAMEAN